MFIIFSFISVFFLVNSGIFKITCFEEHLRRTAASIRCDTINLKQSGLCTTYSFKVFVSELKYKNNLKNRQSSQKIYNSNINNIYLIFYLEIQWFYQDFESENLRFLNLYSIHAARMLDLSLEIMLSLPKRGTRHIYNAKGFFFIREQV